MVNAATELQYRIKDISLDSRNTGLFNTRFLLTIQVINPNRETVIFDRFYGSIFRSGSRIASFDFQNPSGIIVVRAGSYKNVQFPIDVNNLSVGSELLNILKNGLGGSTAITIDGTLYAGNIQIPVEKTIDLKTGKISGTGARIDNAVIC